MSADDRAAGRRRRGAAPAGRGRSLGGDHPERTAQRLDDGLRAACPALADRVPDLRAALADRYEQRRDALRPRDALPADPEPLARRLQADLGLAAAVREPLASAVLDGMAVAADAEAEYLEGELGDALPAGEVRIDADVADEFAAGYARRAVERYATAAEAAAIRRLRQATRADDAALAPAFDRLAGEHPPVLARAALLAAARYGAQALAERTGVVDSKRWVVPDEVACPGHAGMDGRAVAVERSFAVPGGERPGTALASAYVAGEDRPFGCACAQRAVPGDVPTDDPQALAAADHVTVQVDGEPVAPLTDRKLAVYREHAMPGESFGDFVERVHEGHSVRGGARELGVTKKTLYRWLDTYVDGFDRYSGR